MWRGESKSTIWWLVLSKQSVAALSAWHTSQYVCWSSTLAPLRHWALTPLSVVQAPGSGEGLEC